MVEDFVDRFGLGDKGNDSHGRFATPGTFQGIELEDASQQFRPASFCLTHGLGFRLYDFKRLFKAVTVGLAPFRPLA